MARSDSAPLARSSAITGASARPCVGGHRIGRIAGLANPSLKDGCHGRPELHAAPLRCGERVFRPLGDHAPNQDQRPTLLRASVAL